MPPVRDAQEALDAWGSDIAQAQDEKKPAAWFLSLAVPAVPEDGPARDKHRRSLRAAEGTDRIVAPRESHQQKAARLGSIVVVLAVEYHAIVRWEEERLEARFGDEYRAYAARVPRWLPRGNRGVRGIRRGQLAFSWRETLFSERGTLIAMAAGYALLSLKARF